MEIKIDTSDFCIRLYKDVVYLKVVGMQDQEAVDFFIKAIDDMLEKYANKNFSSICDLTELILSSPKLARQVNGAIKKISSSLNYEYNAVIVQPKFLQIVQAYIFAFYMNNTNVKTQVFRDLQKAFHWLDEKGYHTEELKEFLLIQTK